MITMKEYYLKNEGWEDLADPHKMIDIINRSVVTSSYVKTMTLREATAYLNEKYPVTLSMEEWLKKYRNKRKKK